MNQKFVQPPFASIELLPMFIVGGAGLYLVFRSLCSSSARIAHSRGSARISPDVTRIPLSDAYGVRFWLD